MYAQPIDIDNSMVKAGEEGCGGGAEVGKRGKWGTSVIMSTIKRKKRNSILMIALDNTCSLCLGVTYSSLCPPSKHLAEIKHISLWSFWRKDVPG